MTTDEPTEPDVHTHGSVPPVPPVAVPATATWTDPTGPYHVHGTVTGRLTPNEPQPQPLELPAVPTLSPRVIDRHVLTAQDLLERAGDLIHEWLHEATGREIALTGRRPDDPPLQGVLDASRVPELRDWLAAYVRLAGSED